MSENPQEDANVQPSGNNKSYTVEELCEILKREFIKHGLDPNQVKIKDTSDSGNDYNIRVDFIRTNRTPTEKSAKNIEDQKDKKGEDQESP